MDKRHKMPPGIKWRLAITIYGSLGLLIFLIAYLAFYPTSFSIGQKVSIVVISLLVLGGLMAGVWIPWHLNYWEEVEEWFDRFDDDDWDEKKHRKKK